MATSKPAIPTSRITSGIKDERIKCVDNPAQKKKIENPFTKPHDSEVTQVLNREKSERREKIIRRMNEPLHKKTTKDLHDDAFAVVKAIPDFCPSKESPPSPTSMLQKDPEVMQALIKGEKLKNLETTKDFVRTKREIFLIQYLIGVKKDESMRIHNLQMKEERQLNRAESKMEQDAVQFDLFLKNVDTQTIDAMKQVENETKLKLDKVAEIRKINVQIVTIRNKIHKLEEVLQEYKTYSKFLTNVAPMEWKEQKAKEKQLQQQQSTLRKSRADKISTDLTDLRHRTRSMSVISMKGRRKRKMSRKTGPDFKDIPDQAENESMDTLSSIALQVEPSIMRLIREDEDERVELYFTNSQQLLDIFVGMEEENLLMIQKTQDTEENLEELQAEYLFSKKKLTKEIQFLTSQTALLENLVEIEKRKSEEFRFLVKLFSFGPHSEEYQDKLLSELKTKVETTFLKIIGPNDAKLNTLQMMTVIENKLEELLQAIDTLPPDVVEAAEKQRERQRRLAQRQLKLKMQEQLQNERQRRTMDKSTGPRAALGRRLNYRSVPPVQKQRVEKTQLRKHEDEELIYFFT